MPEAPPVTIAARPDADARFVLTFAPDFAFAIAPSVVSSMIPKSGNRFSEKDHAP
jgi:hypothetical protein